MVIEQEPEQLATAGAFLVRHRDTFLRQLPAAAPPRISRTR
ncbi:hypothetical protein [Burkholderia pseudomultivorans]|nr:hypothetical protein [Burkholderia pseudomultivorans]